MEEINQKLLEIHYSLGPLFAFIEEIRSIRNAHRISEESSISMLDLLSLQIKEDVLTTVRAMQIEESKKWQEVESSFKESYKEIRDKLYDQSQTMANLEMDYQSLGDLISRQGGYIENQNKNFDMFRKDLSEKASNSDFIEHKKQLKRYTPIGDFNHLSNQVMECANKSSVDLIRKELINIEKRVKIYITQEELNSFSRKTEESIKGYAVKTYLPIDKFNEEKDFIVKRFDRLEEDIRSLYLRVDANNEAVKKKIKEILDNIKRRPWDSDVQHLQGQVDDCSTKSEFQRLSNFVNPKIEGFSLAITEFTGKIFQFEKIIERYDEIILEKASKDDIRQINSKIPTLALNSTVNHITEKIKVESEYNSDKFYEIKTKSEEISSNISTIFQRIEAIRRENIEVSSVASTLISLAEKLTEKADKSDIYLIYDVMGRKEDIVAIKEGDEVFKKQVEMIVVILQSLCRTFLDGGEAPADLRKQRFHLYRNLKGLIAWISGDDQIKPRLSPVSKSPITLKTENDLDTSAENLNVGRLGRRFRRSIVTSSPRSKGSVDFVNLPPLS